MHSSCSQQREMYKSKLEPCSLPPPPRPCSPLAHLLQHA